MTVLVVVLVLAVVALAASLPPLDARAVQLAERTASRALAGTLGPSPAVRVHGRPFLLQALRGRYHDVEVDAAGLRLGELAGVTLHGRLVNVRLPLRDLLARRAGQLPCDAVAGHLVVPWPELARASRIPGLQLEPDDERVVATAALPVPGLGQLARVSGRARVQLGDGAVEVRVRRVAVAGVAVPAIVLSQLVPALSFRVPLPELPYGLRIERVTVTPDGLRVDGSAHAVTFARR